MTNQSQGSDFSLLALDFTKWPHSWIFGSLDAPCLTRYYRRKMKLSLGRVVGLKCILWLFQKLCLFTAPPLSKAALRNVFERTNNCTHLYMLLNIPFLKWSRIDSAVEYYLQSRDPRKSRNLIFQLDMMGETVLADTIMEYAEPSAGISKGGMRIIGPSAGMLY